ncbi:MAG: M1 aminopeptidase family protein, partial [Planctomycetota bacterium]
MTSLFLLLLGAWQVTYGQALLDRLHTYDLLAYEVVATPGKEGLAVDCRLTVQVLRPGALRFLFSSEVEGLEVTRDGKPVAASLGAGGFEGVLKLLKADVVGVPSLLTLESEAAVGEQVTFRLRYRWRPGGEGFFYAQEDAVQTHLSPFWLPTMADELFDASVEVRTDLVALAPGKRVSRSSFRSTHPLQIVPLVVGRLKEHRRGRLALFLPPDVTADPERMLDDVSSVIEKLESWFGPPAEETLSVVVEPRRRRAPSYCGGSFVVLDRHYFELAETPRLALLAHECSHVWWGHRVATTVVGRGGTWLREGLAEWSGNKVVGALRGEAPERALFRATMRAYVAHLDLRRTGSGLLFANEATLRDATYLDHPAIAYWRGGLVFRLLEQRVPDLRERLRTFADGHAHAFASLEEFSALIGEAGVLDYYVRTTRLPDLVLADLRVEGKRVSATIRCDDPAWPGGEVLVR